MLCIVTSPCVSAAVNVTESLTPVTGAFGVTSIRAVVS